MKRIVFGVLSCLLAGLVGCDCSDDPVGACTSATDCASNLCVDGRCVDADSGVDGAGIDSARDGGTDGAPDADIIQPGECTIAPSATPFENPTLELHWDATDLPFAGHSQVIHSPVVVDFIDDGADESVPEIIFQSYSNTFGNPGVLRVVRGRPPYETLMTLAGDGTGPLMNNMATPSILKDSHPAAGDLDGDGRPEIVVLVQGGGAIAIRNDGTELWRTSAADLPNAEFNSNGSVAIHDLEGDGQPEVAVGRVVLEGATGAVRFTGTGGRGRNGQGPLSCVADVVPASPGQELIAGHTVYSATGTILWEAMDTNDGFCAVADIVDAAGVAARDGSPEVIRIAAGRVYVHEGATGSVLYERALPGCNGDAGRGGAPTVADFEGDGLMEIGVAGAFCYSVIDPECAVMPRPPACRQDGILWRTDTEDNSSSVTSSTVFDFNGDGRAEVVYNDEQFFQVLDGVDGTVIFREPNPSRTRTEQPIVADVDNDGNAEIVFSANNEAGFAGDSIPNGERIPGLEIWSSGNDDWVGARPVWNQHTYHIDHTNNVGAIPAAEPGSWTTHNTYRLNAAVDNPLAAPDLTGNTLATDTARCADNILQVCATIINRGDVRVGPGLEVTFYDGDPDMGANAIGTTTTSEGIDRGGSTQVCIDWNPAPTMATPVFIRVDSADGERECIEDNNVVDLGEARCMTIL